jgi:hypothetical protein
MATMYRRPVSFYGVLSAAALGMGMLGALPPAAGVRAEAPRIESRAERKRRRQSTGGSGWSSSARYPYDSKRQRARYARQHADVLQALSHAHWQAVNSHMRAHFAKVLAGLVA